MNDTVRDKNVDEEEFLRQMRITAVETYKQELVDEIEQRITVLDGQSRFKPSNGRDIGIIRGMVNVKSLIQSHAIKVR